MELNNENDDQRRNILTEGWSSSYLTMWKTPITLCKNPWRVNRLLIIFWCQRFSSYNYISTCNLQPTTCKIYLPKLMIRRTLQAVQYLITLIQQLLCLLAASQGTDRRHTLVNFSKQCVGNYFHLIIVKTYNQIENTQNMHIGFNPHSSTRYQFCTKKNKYLPLTVTFC